MKQVLKDIDYRGVFRYFEEISDVPRGSRYNKLISDYLVKFAEEHHLKYRRDDAENVIIFKEASKGYEHCPAVIIQGHMDMVCVKEEHVVHDFLTEPLNLIVEGDYIRAGGTSLGGDDGIAVAYALAILADDTVVHPKLEVIITTDEEIGMVGATALDTSDLNGKFMLNIDSGEEGIFLSSCAGGLTADIELPAAYVQANGRVIDVSIFGLAGGHSGTEIDKNRVNATRLLGRLLFDLKKSFPYSVTHMEGGSQDNVIPRTSSVSLLVADDMADSVKNQIIKIGETYQNELKTKEPDLKISADIKECVTGDVLTGEVFEKVLFLLLYTPDGIQEMSTDIKGLVESSLNLGIFNVKESKVIYSFSVRSSLESYKQFMSDKLRTISDYVKAEYSTRGEYAAWEYKKESPLREIMREQYIKQYGSEPKVEAVHAGLECGILSAKLEGLDIISFGPEMIDIHTPYERISISSVKRVYDMMLSVFEAICKKYTP